MEQRRLDAELARINAAKNDALAIAHHARADLSTDRERERGLRMRAALHSRLADLFLRFAETLESKRPGTRG